MDMYTIFALIALVALIIFVEEKKYLHLKDGGVYRRHGIALRYYYDVIGSTRCCSFLFSGSGGNMEIYQY